MAQTVVILLGAPGAGKGTQAVRLAEALGMPHVSTGDLFRANLAGGTPLGEKARGFMDQGELVPDELVLEMLFDRVAQDDCQAGYLLDGFPRTMAQAMALTQALGDQRPTVINIDVPDEAIERRIVERRSCKDCGAIYHLTFNPTSVEGVCDRCGGELFQRKDDTSEVVRTRLQEYHAKTEPLVSYYTDLCGLCTVPGQNSPQEVFEACLACLGPGSNAANSSSKPTDHLKTPCDNSQKEVGL